MKPREMFYKLAGKEYLIDLEKKIFNPGILNLIDTIALEATTKMMDDEERVTRMEKIEELQRFLIDRYDKGTILVTLFMLFLTYPGLEEIAENLSDVFDADTRNKAESDQELLDKGYAVRRFSEGTLRAYHKIGSTEFQSSDHMIIERLMKIGENEIMLERFRIDAGLDKNFLFLVAATFGVAGMMNHKNSLKEG